jgi:hypothetical protein
VGKHLPSLINIQLWDPILFACCLLHLNQIIDEEQDEAAHETHKD